MLFRFPLHAVGVCSPLAFLLFFPPAALLFFHLPARLCIAHKTLPLEARPQLLLFASVTLFQFFAQPVLLFLPAAFFFLLALALLLLAAAMLFLFLAPALFLRATLVFLLFAAAAFLFFPALALLLLATLAFLLFAAATLLFLLAATLFLLLALALFLFLAPAFLLLLALTLFLLAPLAFLFLATAALLFLLAPTLLLFPPLALLFLAAATLLFLLAATLLLIAFTFFFFPAATLFVLAALALVLLHAAAFSVHANQRFGLNLRPAVRLFTCPALDVLLGPLLCLQLLPSAHLRLFFGPLFRLHAGAHVRFQLLPQRLFFLGAAFGLGADATGRLLLAGAALVIFLGTAQSILAHLGSRGFGGLALGLFALALLRGRTLVDARLGWFGGAEDLREVEIVDVGGAGRYRGNRYACVIAPGRRVRELLDEAAVGQQR
ncbi:MAG TPA: hypothetical protein VMH32_19940 [Burkholderiales bacterium]|nr:hypothetical protein [Burkholderiales bacterium]